MTDPTPPVRVHVADAAVARVAGRAPAVPGVVALRADLRQTLLGIAGSVLGPSAAAARRRGAARGAGRIVQVALTVVTRLGHNCRDLAAGRAARGAAEIVGYTGLPTHTVDV